MRLISLLLAGASIVFAMLLITDFGVFLDPPSAAIVLGITVFVTLAQHTLGSIGSAFRTALGSDKDSGDVQEHVAVLGTVRVAAIGAGVVATLIGLVNMLANMDDPSSVGPAMAVACLTMLYGVLIAEVLIAPLIGGMTRPLPIPDSSSHGQADQPATGYSSDPAHAESPASPQERSVAGPIMAILGSLGFILMGITFGGELGLFIDPPSCCIVFLTASCLVFGQYSFEEVVTTFGAALRGRPLSSRIAATHGRMFSTIRSILHGVGMLGFLIGLVVMLASLDDPKSIGPAMAVSILSSFYALVIAEFLVAPMANALPARVTDPEALELDAPSGNLFPASFFLVSCIVVFFILLLAMK